MFQADPLWPEPLPNGWILAATIGVSSRLPGTMSGSFHRPQTLEQKETYQTRKEADCCTAAPDVLEFDAGGKTHPPLGQRPQTMTGRPPITASTIDKDGNVWLGANGAPQPGPATGQPGAIRRHRGPARRRARGTTVAGTTEGGGERGTYHDSFVLKFSPDGKFLGEIGHANGSKGSLDTENVRGVGPKSASCRGTNEVVLADGYGNHRVSVWDAATMKFKRMWGAYGKPPSDDPIPHYDVNSPQFGNPVHCAQPSSDGLIYVCDRTNNRIQVFKTDGPM